MVNRKNSTSSGPCRCRRKMEAAAAQNRAKHSTLGSRSANSLGPNSPVESFAARVSRMWLLSGRPGVAKRTMSPTLPVTCQR